MELVMILMVTIVQIIRARSNLPTIKISKEPQAPATTYLMALAMSVAVPTELDTSRPKSISSETTSRTGLLLSKPRANVMTSRLALVSYFMLYSQFLLLDDGHIKQHDDRITDLENALKLMNRMKRREGTPDSGSGLDQEKSDDIIAALNDIANDIRKECEKKYAPIEALSSSRQEFESHDGLYRRV